MYIGNILRDYICLFLFMMQQKRAFIPKFIIDSSFCGVVFAFSEENSEWGRNDYPTRLSTIRQTDKGRQKWKTGAFLRRECKKPGSRAVILSIFMTVNLSFCIKIGWKYGIDFDFTTRFRNNDWITIECVIAMNYQLKIRSRDGFHHELSRLNTIVVWSKHQKIFREPR